MFEKTALFLHDGFPKDDMRQIHSKVPSISSLFKGIFDDWISMKEIQMEDLGKDKKTVTESSAKRGGGWLTNKNLCISIHTDYALIE